jgi:hypothetical protein
MSRPTSEVADIVRAAGNSFWEQQQSHLAWPHRKALDAIVRCRTAALGGHRDQCVRCGHQAISFNSCRNRPIARSPRPPQTPTAHFKRPYRNCPGAAHCLPTHRICRGSPDRDLSFPITCPREIAFRLRSIFATWNTALLNGVRFSRTIFSLAPSGALEMIIESVLVRRPDLENHEQGYDMANQNIAFHQPTDTGLLNIPTLLHRVRILWGQFGALALGRKRLSNRSFRREACAVTWLDNEKQRMSAPRKHTP